MFFIVVGVLLIVLKFAEFGPVAAWSWWLVLAPFACALAWWTYADSSGLTKRREMDKLEEKKKDRRRKALDALGIDRDAQRRGEEADRARRAAASRVENQRARQREDNEKVIRDSVFDSKTGGSTFDDSRQAGGSQKPD